MAASSRSHTRCDVVGYSRLMEADEEGTLAQLRSHREELVNPTIAEHHGRVVKLVGDGVLVEFGSAADAVRCAIGLQEGMATRLASVPELQRTVFRIGVNMGDIIFEDGDIFGDGVNVAARLEGMGDPGGVLISQSVRISLRLQSMSPSSTMANGSSKTSPAPFVCGRGHGSWPPYAAKVSRASL